MKTENSITRLIAENIPDAVMAADMEGKIKYCSPSAERLLGLSAASADRKSIYDMVSRPGEVKLLTGLFKEMRAARRCSGGPFKCIVTMNSGADREFSAEISGACAGKGNERVAVLVVRDVTEQKKIEEAVIKYKLVSDNSSDAHFLVDSDASFRYVNKSACRMFQYSEEEFLGMSVPDVDIVYTLDKYGKLFKRIQSGAPPVIETINMRKDGSLFPSEITMTGCRIKGTPYMLAALRDITAHKLVMNELQKTRNELQISIRARTSELLRVNEELQAKIKEREIIEAALRESEKRFRVAALSTLDLIWEGDIRNDSLEWFGDIDSMLGYEKGEFPRTISGHLKCLHAGDLERFRAEVDKAIRTGNDFSSEYRIKCKDGTLRYWKERGKPLAYENGIPVKWVGAITDITNRRSAEETLLRSEREYRKLSNEFNSLLNSIPDNLFLLSRDLKLIWANRSVEAYSGTGFDRLKGSYCYELCCKLNEPCEECPAVITFETGSESGVTMRRPDGTHWDIRTVPVKDEKGTVINVIEIGRDISSRVRMEEESRVMQNKLIHANKMTSLGTLVSGVAHEINNPNSFILSNAELIFEIWKDTRAILSDYFRRKGDFTLGGMKYSRVKSVIPRLVEGMIEGSQRINHIVENLKEFSRPRESGFDDIVYPEMLVASAYSIIENQVEQYTDFFNMENVKKTRPVKGDYKLLEQVVINIMINALQSLRERNKAVSVSTHFEKEAGYAVIRVSDEGSGMDKDILERITEPFFTTKLESGGLGLGLSISYAIIKDHGGLLEFTSREGKGTVSSIKLPVYKTSGDE